MTVLNIYNMSILFSLNLLLKALYKSIYKIINTHVLGGSAYKNNYAVKCHEQYKMADLYKTENETVLLDFDLYK